MKTTELSREIVALIHHVQLNDSGWWNNTVDQLIKASLWTNGRASSHEHLRAIIQDATGIQLDLEHIAASTDRLHSSGDLFSMIDGSIKLAEHASSAIENKVKSIEEIEHGAMEVFNSALANAGITEELESIWHKFRTEALVPVIIDIGARTYDLIQHKGEQFENLHIVKSFIKSFDPDTSEKVRVAIREFISSDEQSVRKYLLANMTSAFCAQAHRLSKSSLDALLERSQEPVEFILFLDTNFLYSLLDLHDNPSNEAAVGLVNILKNKPHGITVKLYVLQHTIDETRKSLQSNLNNVMRVHTSPNIAHVARHKLSGVLNRYFNTVGSKPTVATARDYFEPYINNLLMFLRERGVELYNHDLGPYSMRQDVIDDTVGRLNFLGKKHANNTRTYETLLHDVIMWHVAREKRGQAVESPADAKYWVVTIDYAFLGWDSFKRRHKTNSVQLCVHPSSLLQMLQFWLPRDDEYEEALLDSMKLPFFYQEFDADAEKITLQILTSLSRFEDVSSLSEDSIERVVVNTALRSRIALTEDETKQIEYVKNALIEQNNRLEKSLNEVNRQLSDKSEALKEIKEETNNTIAKLEKVIKNKEDNYKELSNQFRTLKNSYEIAKIRKNKRYALIITWVVLLLLLITLIALSLVAYYLIAGNWDRIEPLWAVITFIAPIVIWILGLRLPSKEKLQNWIFRKLMQTTDADHRMPD